MRLNPDHRRTILTEFFEVGESPKQQPYQLTDPQRVRKKTQLSRSDPFTVIPYRIVSYRIGVDQGLLEGEEAAGTPTRPQILRNSHAKFKAQAS